MSGLFFRRTTPFVLAALLAACAPTRPPADRLDAASRALGEARDRGAAQYAAADYRAAARQFDAASEAESRNDYAAATALAEQSLANSELASARARRAKAAEEAGQLESDNRRLESLLAQPVDGGRP